MNPTISNLSINPSFFILLATISSANLLYSAVVVYLFSIFDIFASQSVFWQDYEH